MRVMHVGFYRHFRQRLQNNSVKVIGEIDGTVVIMHHPNIEHTIKIRVNTFVAVECAVLVVGGHFVEDVGIDIHRDFGSEPHIVIEFQ